MGILEKMKLNGKKAFVTGGARGIGKCLVTALVEAGADVAIIDMNIELAEKTAKEIGSTAESKVFALKGASKNLSIFSEGFYSSINRIL